MKKLALLSLVLGACTHDVTAVDPINVGAGDVDVLYVLDNSADRADYDTMAGQLDVLSTQLATFDGQLPDLHVGVVTADMGIQGTDDALAPANFRNCAGTGDGGKLTIFDADVANAFVDDRRGPDGARIKNYGGELTDLLGQLTNPAGGKIGCEVAQPMEAMRRALDPANNPSFVRTNARLMVVFLSADDDCSLKSGSFLGAGNANGALCATQGVVCDDDPGANGPHANCVPRTDGLVTPVSEYVAFLTDLKGGAAQVTVAAVAGPSEPFTTAGSVIQPSCTGAGGDHKPAVRLNALAEAFGGTKVNGCTQDAAYDQITSTYLARAGSCFPQANNADDCRVIETADGAETSLPRCVDGSAAACFSTFTDADRCPDGANIGVTIERRGGTLPASSTIRANCAVD